jgi:glycosyltransferase involved in cell wall biosynthesis
MSYELSANTEPYLSIVIPVYNEGDNVRILYQEIRGSLDPTKKPYEIIFIDDGSSDSTLESLRSIKTNELKEKRYFSFLRIIKFSRNFGQTAAMQAGFDHAKGEVIVSLDGDLQNDPKDIPKLLNKLEEGYDIVCGWRKNRRDKALTRTLPSKIANWMIRRVIGVSIHDLGCSLKAYRSPVIKSVKLYSDMHRFIPVLTALKGARVSEMVVNHRPRKFGKTKYGLSRTWKVLFDLITLKMIAYFQDRPLRWFALFGFLFGVLGVVLGAASVAVYLQGIESMVFSTASFLVFFLSGNLISWGLLAEYFISQEKR